MKNKRIIPINAINLAVIITVTVIVGLLTQNIIESLTIRDIENVTRLTHTNIYADIEKELIEPVNTSIIMAQNTLLFDFMNEDTQATTQKMATYLTAIQKATGYESVFLIPDKTLNYYYPGGTDEKVDLNSDSSFWYKARIHAKDAYSAVVNTEQLDNLALTLYVDANIKDKNGNFAGVAGVGKRLTHLQKILTRYLDQQGVEAYLTNGEGLVVIHRDNKLIKKVSFYALESTTPAVIDIKQSREKTVEKLIGNRFYIVQYVPMLDWYLIVKKSSSELTGQLNHYSAKIMIALILGALVILLVTSYATYTYRQQIMSLSNTDHLTDIPNRTLFEHELQKAIDNIDEQPFCLALFDLDNLKVINDSYGHDKGDHILQLVASSAKEIFQAPDFVARVGGDEFAVIAYKPVEEARLQLEYFQRDIKNNMELQIVKSTVSVGLTKCEKSDSKTSLYKRADEALYMSKKTGKDRTYIC